MISLREALSRIEIAKTLPVSYRGFASRPRSLRQAIASTQAPTTQSWVQVKEVFRDEDWTDEVQGMAWDGSHWIFSADANQSKPGHNDKAIYSFAAGAALEDGNWTSRVNYKDVPHPFAGSESDDHWGQVTFFEGSVFVAHFRVDAGQASVVVFDDVDGVLSFNRWIELDHPKSSIGDRVGMAEFQAINPWDGLLYTCFGSGAIHEFFMHDAATGAWTGDALKLAQPVTLVQGACFSPNGHLYIASNELLAPQHTSQAIWCYSALNGYRFGVIAVQTAMPDPDTFELEGICVADVAVGFGDLHAQVHAVVLVNDLVGLDNLVVKSFATTQPAIV